MVLVSAESLVAVQVTEVDVASPPVVVDGLLVVIGRANMKLKRQRHRSEARDEHRIAIVLTRYCHSESPGHKAAVVADRCCQSRTLNLASGPCTCSWHGTTPTSLLASRHHCDSVSSNLLLHYQRECAQTLVKVIRSHADSRQTTKMAGGHGPGGHGGHPVHIHPVRPLYRFAAVGLGASMWFFVRALKFEGGITG